MSTTATYRVRCDDCSATLYTDRIGDEYPTPEAAEAARTSAGWDDGYGRTACPTHKRTPTGGEA